MNSLPLKIHYQIKSRIGHPFWFIINYIYGFCWGIKYPSSTSFIGKVCLRKYSESDIKIGENCEFLSKKTSNWIGIYCPCIISTLTRNAQIVIGNYSGFSGTVIGCAKKIYIGNNVRCGANTLITDSDWHQNDQRTGIDAEVVIEDNVWLCYGVKVLKGVHIGRNSVIGAGSIVTHDIPSNVIAAGNPCKVIKEINK